MTITYSEKNVIKGTSKQILELKMKNTFTKKSYLQFKMPIKNYIRCFIYLKIFIFSKKKSNYCLNFKINRHME